MKRGYYFFGLWLLQPILLARSEPGGFAHTVDTHLLSTFFVKRPEIWQKQEYKTDQYFLSDQPDNIHFIPIGTSIEYHHYRHQVNIQLQYKVAKWLGVPDSTIHTFLSECFACDNRNLRPGTIFFEESHQDDINNPSQGGIAGSFLVPFKAGPCNDMDALRFIAGQRRPYSPSSRILKSTSQSYIHIFLSGHGSYGLVKFKDFYEISNYVFAEAVARLKIKDQFKKMFILVDSCQALTMADFLFTPQTFLVASSAGGQHAYSCNEDSDIGVSLMDRMSYLMADFFRRLDASGANITMEQFFGGMDPAYLLSEPVNDTRLIHHSLDQEWLVDWFAAPDVNKEIRKLGAGDAEPSFQPAPRYRPRIGSFNLL